MAFPPIPVYPEAIDTNQTLYLVYNTTESRLSADNQAWSQEIDIISVGSDENEIWPSNGFATIEGELFYYDSVGLNGSGKVQKLKGCARQMGGESTRFNKRGTWVRGFVVAQHHNQLVDGIMKTQNFIGYNFTPDMSTLDWKIRNLQELEVIWDDFSCPDINFTFNLVENDPVTGILAEYSVQITPPGNTSNFRIDFGDGDFTTTSLNGEHRYAVNARIDPIIRISNDKCQLIQTPIERDNPAEPAPETEAGFDVALPEIPPTPDFTFVPCEIPEPEINLPAFVGSCISLEGQIGPIPSVITGPTINMVSQVTITSNNPVNITQSVITIISDSPIPSLIIIDPPIPSTIIVDPPIPPTILIVAPQSNITVDFDFGDMPRFEVDWGMPPEMEVSLTMSKQVKTPQRFAVDPELMNEFGTEFSDLFDVSQTMQVQYEPVGIPSEINVIVPELQDFKIDHGELFNKKIQIDSTNVNIPTDIYIHGPESLIPDSIILDGSDLLKRLSTVLDMHAVKIDASEMPRTISVELNRAIPDRILVEIPKPIPERIIVESNIPSEIILKGPESIPVHVPEGIGLPVLFPDVMPEIPLVFRGPPVEFKITMDQILDKSGECTNPVMIVPCNRN